MKRENIFIDETKKLIDLLSQRGIDQQIDEITHSGKTETILVKKIVFDARLAIRDRSFDATVESWSRLILDGEIFPPLHVRRMPDGSFTVIDGVLRFGAICMTNARETTAVVHDCDEASAMLMRVRMNARHGMQLSKNEKKQILYKILSCPGGETLSARRLGRMICVYHKTVITWRNVLFGEFPQKSANSGRVRNAQPDAANDERRPDSFGNGNPPMPPGLEETGSPRQPAADEEQPIREITVAGKTETISENQIPEKAAAAQRIWNVQAGDCYRVRSAMGDWNHYINCGDSSLPETWARFTKNPAGALLCTDPPYSGYIPGSGRDHSSSESDPVCLANRGGSPRLRELLMPVLSNVAKALKPGAYFYIFEGFHYRDIFAACVTNALGGRIHQPFSWVKSRYRKPMYSVFAFGSENGLFGWIPRPGVRLARIIPGATTVHIGEEFENSPYDVGGDYHACSKPVLLLNRFIGRHSLPGNVVIEPFLGSGSTAVAAEISRRICVGVEFLPEYVAVTLERLSRLGCAVEKMQPGDEFHFPDFPTIADKLARGEKCEQFSDDEIIEEMGEQ